MLDPLLSMIASQECAHVVVPEASDVAMRYYSSGNILWIFSQAWSFIVPLLFLCWGFTGKLERFSERTGRKKWFLTYIIYIVVFLIIYNLLNLPLDFYTEYVRSHAYGLSSQTLGRWFSNHGKEFLVGLIGTLAFIWIFYLLLKKSPRRWWIYGSLVSIGIMFILTYVQPIWIDPLFHHFGPMKNKSLEKEILALASRAGIEHGHVYEVDMSQDTKTLNAYVVGLAGSNRIVLWDTTIKQMSKEQILFVMGHEMGHYVLQHIFWSFLYNAALAFLIFYLTYRLGSYLLARYKKRFAFKYLYNFASLPLFLLLFKVFLLLTLPLSNFISRIMEHQADRFGLEITQNSQAAGEAFIALQQENLAIPRPGPIHMFWRASHPSLGERIDFCNSYCPWKEGKKLWYNEHFKTENEP